MFDRFRKKDPAARKLEEDPLVEAAKKRPTLELCFNIGRTLLSCAMVEDQINDVLDYVTPVGIERGSWLADDRRPLLSQAIKEMRKRYGIDQDFYDDLVRFRDSRNKFVHGIWRISKHRLNSVEGNQEVMEFVLDLRAQAANLTAIFYPLLTRFHGGQLRWTEEQVQSWLPEEMRTPK